MSRDFERIEVRFSGHVQGVGFRYTTHSISRGHEVSGYVENLPDGTVRLVAEGLPEDLARFVASIEARMSGHVAQTHVNRSVASGEFDGFRIKT